MKNRCILSLLICCALLYYALPELTLHGSNLAAYFSWSWLALLMFAVAGNLAAILYTPKRKKQARQTVSQTSIKKVRHFEKY